MKLTKRTAFSWDAEFKPHVEKLRSELKGFSSSGVSTSSVEIFMLCLAFGFANGTCGKLPPKNSDGPRISYFQLEQIAVIKAIALAESESAEILVDEEAVYDIVEKYAAGGLMLLANAFDTQPNFKDWLKTKLEEYSKNN